MIVGVLKEVKDNENRVGLTPSSCTRLTSTGHTVLVEQDAGEGAGFSDDDYVAAGCTIRDLPEAIAADCDILVKVKEPIAKEFGVLDHLAGKTLYTFLHLAAAPKALTEKLLETKITSVAYETIERDGALPCLTPMSEVAGVLAVQYGAQYLQKKYGGRGMTLGSIIGAAPAHVVVIGGGVVGGKAARTALGMGCRVSVFERDDESAQRVRKRLTTDLSSSMREHLSVIASTTTSINDALAGCDLLIGAVLVPGAKAPRIISEAQVSSMPQGSVIVDVAIDQGGCIWGSQPTSHSDPIYERHGTIYCCITNMPGQAPLQSTIALNAATLPYLEAMCAAGVLDALNADCGLAKGVNTHKGSLVLPAVGAALGIEATAHDF